MLGGRVSDSAVRCSADTIGVRGGSDSEGAVAEAGAKGERVNVRQCRSQTVAHAIDAALARRRQLPTTAEKFLGGDFLTLSRGNADPECFSRPRTACADVSHSLARLSECAGSSTMCSRPAGSPGQG